VKIVDTNLLLYSVNPLSPHHAPCRAWLETALRATEPLGFAWVVLLGFVRMATSHRVFPKPLSLAVSLKQVDEWMAAVCSTLVLPADGHWELVKELLTARGAGGNLTTDIHLAALAIERGATLVSCDSDFARFTRLKWENPIAVP
jgi:toxin-antitoxin system PIN domain toxin